MGWLFLAHARRRSESVLKNKNYFPPFSVRTASVHNGERNGYKIDCAGVTLFTKHIKGGRLCSMRQLALHTTQCSTLHCALVKYRLPPRFYGSIFSHSHSSLVVPLVVS